MDKDASPTAAPTKGKRGKKAAGTMEEQLAALQVRSLSVPGLPPPLVRLFCFEFCVLFVLSVAPRTAAP
jgi:hypothetical protein